MKIIEGLPTERARTWILCLANERDRLEMLRDYHMFPFSLFDIAKLEAFDFTMYKLQIREDVKAVQQYVQPTAFGVGVRGLSGLLLINLEKVIRKIDGG